MDDTTNITALDMISMPIPQPRKSLFRRLAGMFGWASSAIDERSKSKVRNQLAKEIFAAEAKKRR